MEIPGIDAGGDVRDVGNIEHAPHAVGVVGGDRDDLAHAAADVPLCDAIVVAASARSSPFSSTARMMRRLGAKSSVPVVVLPRK